MQKPSCRGHVELSFGKNRKSVSLFVLEISVFKIREIHERLKFLVLTHEAQIAQKLRNNDHYVLREFFFFEKIGREFDLSLRGVMRNDRIRTVSIRIYTKNIFDVTPNNS